MTLFNLIVAATYKLAVRHRRGILPVLVDESTDERKAVAEVLLWKELVGALCDRS